MHRATSQKTKCTLCGHFFWRQKSAPECPRCVLAAEIASIFGKTPESRFDRFIAYLWSRPRYGTTARYLRIPRNRAYLQHVVETSGAPTEDPPKELPGSIDVLRDLKSMLSQTGAISYRDIVYARAMVEVRSTIEAVRANLSAEHLVLIESFLSKSLLCESPQRRIAKEPVSSLKRRVFRMIVAVREALQFFSALDASHLAVRSVSGAELTAYMSSLTTYRRAKLQPFLLHLAEEGHLIAPIPPVPRGENPRLLAEAELAEQIEIVMHAETELVSVRLAMLLVMIGVSPRDVCELRTGDLYVREDGIAEVKLDTGRNPVPFLTPLIIAFLQERFMGHEPTAAEYLFTRQLHRPMTGQVIAFAAGRLGVNPRRAGISYLAYGLHSGIHPLILADSVGRSVQTLLQYPESKQRRRREINQRKLEAVRASERPGPLRPLKPRSAS